MITRECEGVRWLEFELLAGCPVVHGCFLRHGGESAEHLSSLNLSYTVGDHSKVVDVNRRRACNALELPVHLSAKLCHGSDIFRISSNDEEIPMSDGISTSTPNLGMMVTQADCQAAIFYDPIQHVLSNVHCGWRGSVQNIYSNVVAHMQEIYGSKAADLLVCISPSLGPENSEFINYKEELPKTFLEFQVKPVYFDFWSISEWQLVQAGVLPHHIQIARIDTYANSEDYFSHRRSRFSGRQGTVCALKNVN